MYSWNHVYTQLTQLAETEWRDYMHQHLPREILQFILDKSFEFFVVVFFFFFFWTLYTTLHGLWDLSSPTRDWTLGPSSWKQWKHWVLTTSVCVCNFSPSIFFFPSIFDLTLVESTHEEPVGIEGHWTFQNRWAWKLQLLWPKGSTEPEILESVSEKIWKNLL